jgi:hypothetical protein
MCGSCRPSDGNDDSGDRLAVDLMYCCDALGCDQGAPDDDATGTYWALSQMWLEVGTPGWRWALMVVVPPATLAVGEGARAATSG